jgi:hypothetical protein
LDGVAVCDGVGIRISVQVVTDMFQERMTGRIVSIHFEGRAGNCASDDAPGRLEALLIERRGRCDNVSLRKVSDRADERSMT